MTKKSEYLKLRTHLKIAVLCCVFGGTIQGFVESFVLSVRNNDLILWQKTVPGSQIFLLLERLLGFGANEHASFLVDRYLGPGLACKMPLFLSSIAIYSSLGLLAGISLGFFLWLGSRWIKKTISPEKLCLLYFSLLLGSALILNLLIFLNKNSAINRSAPEALIVDLSFLIQALFLAGLIFRLGSKLIEKRSVQSRIPSIRALAEGKIVFFCILMVPFVALLLNLFLYRAEKKSFLAKLNRHNPSSIPMNRSGSDANVILISIDSLRADHLSSYGYPRKTSPNMDRLAGEGIAFSNAYSVTSWTLPAHASMLTSMYPVACGVVTIRDFLDPARITLAEVLRKEGYETAAFVSGPPLNHIYGFNQGFQHYDDFTVRLKTEQESHEMVTSVKLNGAIQAWLGKNFQKKFFLFLHYWDVHYDYIPPPPYDTLFDPEYRGNLDARLFMQNPRIWPGMALRDLQHIVALYDGEIALTDHFIGELLSRLQELGIYEKTLIVLTSDHGDEFFEHGRKAHRRTLYNEVLRAPLIIKFPSNFRFGANKRLSEPASLVDIMPTILDYLGIAPNKEMQGRTLLPLATGGKHEDDQMVYSSLGPQLAAVQSSRYKLIHYFKKGTIELYDAIKDGDEKKNLLGKQEDRTASEKLLRLLSDWLNLQRATHEFLPKQATKRKVVLSDAMEEELRALGYLQN